MEERKKYVCKYCSKSFPCGKSLGGHIRTHMMTEERNNNNNVNVVVDGADDKDNINRFIKLGGTVMRNNNNKKRDLSWCEDSNNNPIYGLRENPKKTMRFVHSSGGAANANNNEQQQQNKEDKRFCKECGKGFPSLKALCGHMACHSEKEKRTTATTTIKFEEKLVRDSHSDTETSTHPRRSKRMRVTKTIKLSNHNNPFSFSSSPSSSGVVPLVNNGSSPVSEVEQEEQEEVARCLMLLSRDSGSFNFKSGRFASVTEFSDNNSVILEAKSSSPDTLIGVISYGNNNNNNNFVSNNNHAYDLVEKKLLKVKNIKFKSVEFGASDNYSGARVFRYGPKTKMVDSDFSNDELKRSKLGDKSSKYTASVVKKLVMEDLDYDRTYGGTTRKFDSRKRGNYDLVGVSSKNGTKGWKYECFEGERDNNSSYEYSIDDESDENSSETESFPAPGSHHKSKALNGKKCTTNAKKKKLKPSKKSKDHECPICYKIFKSGQALGGHKRSHFIGGSEENTVLIKQVVPNFLIDLNLPAPVDE
ncbi:hypothetical protein JHK82_055055 [Glycine max]|nr:hypothetical protein JHK82_055055 [Glycine max]